MVNRKGPVRPVRPARRLAPLGVVTDNGSQQGSGRRPFGSAASTTPVWMLATPTGNVSRLERRQLIEAKNVRTHELYPAGYAAKRPVVRGSSRTMPTRQQRPAAP